MIQRLIPVAFGGVLLAGAAIAGDLPQGDPEQGRKVAGQCRTCHGLDGFARIPIAPHIGGEPIDYLASQLLAFRSGLREHEMMTVVTKSLTDQAIADVSVWYAEHHATATLSASAEDAPEDCVACHGVNGISTIEDAPNLAGETTIYLETQLKAFRNGKRTHDVMSEVAAELDDNEIRAVSEWYSSIKLEISDRD